MTAALALGAFAAGPSIAQEATPAAQDGDIVVRAGRPPGSIDTDILPTATFDAQAIRDLGVTSVADFVKKLVLATDGAPPIFTLNGRLPASPEEIFLLPMEAFQQIASYPGLVATKFGYPPTRPVLNFITKARFGAVELKANYQAGTDGGTANHNESIGFTRIRNQRRLSLTAGYSRTTELRQDERRIAPDPAVNFDTIGNIGAVVGDEIDPTLTALVGFPIAIAPVPADPARRSDLDAYAEDVGMARLADTAAFRSLLPDQESWKLSGAIASPIGSNAMASAAASLERKWDWSLLGLPSAILPIAAGNPASPFTTDVLLYRYLEEAGPVRRRGTSTTARGALGGSGQFGGWGWNLTASADRQQLETVTRGNVDVAGLTSQITAGRNPFAPFAANPSLFLPEERSRTVLTNADARAVVNGVLLAVPAGHVTVVATATAQQSSADRTTLSASASTARIGRFQSSASIALDIPLTATLSVDAKAGVTRIDGFGGFVETSFGFNWKPLLRVQLGGSIAHARNAPPLVSLASPIVTSPNVPFFDFVTGKSVLVTAFAGGNPALDAERQRTASLTLNVQPIARSELRLQFGYVDTRVTDQVGTISTLTPRIQEAFPDIYVRDAAGQLVSVNFQPVNFAARNQRDLSATLSMFGQLGKAPPPDATMPPERIRYFLWLGPHWRLEDTLLLRRGLKTLNLLDGDTVGQTGGSPRFQFSGTVGLSYRGANLNFSPNWGSATRIRNADPASDLLFSSLFKLGMEMSVMFDGFAPKSPWARGARIALSVDNLFNARQRVLDGNGVTPNRYQPAWLDPQGRAIQLSLRKMF